MNEPRTVLADRWPLLLLAIVAGGSFGLLASFALPARFQSTAALAINIDYGRSQPLELIVEDRALDRVYQLLTSDETLTEVAIRLAGQSGSDPDWQDLAALRSRTRLDQKLARWELIAFTESPGNAAAIANAWAEVALEALGEASQHARVATQLEGFPSVVSCTSITTGTVKAEAFWQCVSAADRLTDRELSLLHSEIDSSHGILPNLSFELIQAATPSDQPVLWSRGIQVFAGGFVGGLAALAAIGVSGQIRAGQR